MNRYILIIIVSLISLLTSCHQHTEGDGHSHGTEDAHAGHSHENTEDLTTTSLTDEQIKSIKLEYGKIEKKQLTASLKANGLLRVPNNNRATVSSLFSGVIKSILVQTGKNVTKGQVIATLTNTSLINMQEEYLSITAKLELAQLEYERQQAMKENNASALKTFQQAATELKTLKARKASLKTQLNMAGINTKTLSSENIQSVLSIKSPISGAISTLNINIGSFVETNTAIAEIVDNSQLHVDLYVYEKDLYKLRNGQTIHFTLTNNPGKEYDADIYSISNTFEPNTKAVSVHATVKGNKQGLIDGMSITALVSLEDATVEAVPVSAIVNHEGQDYIFIVTNGPAANQDEHDHEGHDHEGHNHDDHNHEGHNHDEDHKETKTTASPTGTFFERIPIKRGTTDVGYSEITLLKDVPKDVKIVTNGAFFIMAKMTNQGEAHEH
ncbi:MAG TPA: efflux RND transporter periplasmic adaptor subunit [Saprospiraceae bacterium]|nr:efflux RND transporter periplasmic adaptor subunit [Saprospiraceae bacterium]MCC6688064.1 efflux RND transporter periplasmic adaptor subunit [Saprospiraceae bacterium]HMV22914.1 efflux RND transporter periplasmic adaptor subunit [Saprospiraceae bacterium]HMX82089.1 efflux RND transporter periplasmic adaptor subunit [Saprospiraceae bacterium]HMX86199.1 efflux RND transporter periplasmic adaptor subunit [Saprospiraceae bacterium]